MTTEHLLFNSLCLLILNGLLFPFVSLFINSILVYDRISLHSSKKRLVYSVKVRRSKREKMKREIVKVSKG